jgi:hypothetical protein
MTPDRHTVPASSLGHLLPSGDLRVVWQEQPHDAFLLTEELRRTRAASIDRGYGRLRVLSAAQHIGTMFGILASGTVAVWARDPLMRAGAVLLALTFLYRLVILRRTPPPFDGAGPIVSADPSLIAYRTALVRRMAEDRGPRLWSRLAIGAPAAAVFLYGFARAYPSLASMIALEAVAMAAGLTFAFASAVRRARRCQAELHTLDQLEE